MPLKDKEARKDYDKRWRAANKERRRVNKREWYWANREECLAYNKEWNTNNPARYIMTKAKTRSKKLGMPFDLVPLDIVFPDVCPILGIPLVPADGQKTDNSPSLDRIIPELGYVRGNVQVISERANRIKNNATMEELVKLGQWAEQQLKAKEK